jgi:L,D-transpeptidase ErfK/SrfK
MALLAGAAAGAARAASPTPPQGALIGELQEEVIAAGDTLVDLAARHDLGFIEVVAANPGVDPWLPAPGQRVLLPRQHLLPAAPRKGIVVNLPELRLYYYPPAGERPRSFPISIGDEGSETRLGATQVIRKTRWPSWTPTASERAADPELPRTVPPGPGNPMGEFALYLGWPSYAIHGTSKPFSIGRRGSHGCIRMYAEDIDLLHQLVAVGTAVNVVDERAKAGWQDGVLYLQVHPGLGDLNALETQGRRASESAYDASALVRQMAGEAVERVDWDAVLLAGLQQTGVPVAVTPALDPGH